ncbi:hypothetical protein [Rhodococcus sp. C3V]|uniref:hypothetical protein n=1 Tax=Rhodococcus sp. C3V TaxID=3034165 RepID=UPI0023E1D6BC|nr:hypothetical protein [Rhodococcus sp. C3V]MDF3316458.1 hypothetical protein [Rhodococcus sp. C3V]
MATIQLYTTALKHHATYDITSRDSIYDPMWKRVNIKIRVDQTDVPTDAAIPEAEVTIARIIEHDGETTSYRVESHATWFEWRQSSSVPWNAIRKQSTDYVLTRLSDDAERIVEAVLAKPVTSEGVRDTRIHINIAPSDLSSMLRRQQQLQTFAVKASRIEALERKVRVAQWQRAAAYERLRGTEQTSWFDPRRTADENLSAAKCALAEECSSE